MRMNDIGPATEATVMVCITCRDAADRLTAATRAADTRSTETLAADAPGADSLGAEAPRAGMLLADATACAATAVRGVSVQRIRCLGNCSRGPSAAIRCDSSWTYIFGGLEPDRDASALIIGAQLLAQAADGIMPWRGRPESLKRGLIARVPPAGFREEST
jgi:predicted metal-binding protein